VAEREGGAHAILETIYRDDNCRAALEELFHRKCAYCETVIAGATWEVEHFRPKGRVAERADHPGYYWLAYEWRNLYPTCELCNKRRKDRPLWGDLRYAGTGGKLDQFPLEDEALRAMSHTENLSLERPLLLDPCTDWPESHLRYDLLGQVQPAPADRRARASITVFNLKRRRLRDLRRNRIDDVVALLKLIRDCKDREETEAAADLEDFLENRFLSDGCAYAGAARFVRSDPDAFGV